MADNSTPTPPTPPVVEASSPAVLPAPPPAEADSIDKPACFYLGREYDLATKKVLPDKLIMYDARNLTTHGVIVGMTGSGKTGLSIALLEEAAIDGIPAVIIDPKGDLTNLLLQFPDLSPQKFAEWLNPDDARQKNLSVDEYARQLSERWRKGLIDSNQAPDRRRELSNVTDFRIYTPGSEAGLQLSILRTFAAPKGRLPLEDLNQKINATATALLGLSGITADPMQSREHVLIAQLLNHAWTNGKDLDLPSLIKEIQTPSIHTVGAYNLETFFPAKERLKFASQLNNMLASPMFTTWTQGEPLDLASMLYRNGRPQHLIFYFAHLDDNQRMFFTTLLLEEMLSWTRRQSGTTSLQGAALLRRGVRLSAAAPRQSAEQAALADVAETGAGLRRGRAAGDAEPGGPRLQGAVQRRHLVRRQAADGTRQGPPARRPGERGGGVRDADRSRLPGEGDRLAGQPHLPAAQHQPGTAEAVPDPLGAVVPARADDARGSLALRCGDQGARCGRRHRAGEAVQPLWRRGASGGRQSLSGLWQEPLGPCRRRLGRRPSPGWQSRRLPARPPRLASLRRNSRKACGTRNQCCRRT